MYEKVRYRNIDVSFLPHLDGGGRGFGQEYVRVIKERFGKVDHIFEYCAGPGFIGFSLLAHGLCNKLTLSDINPEAIRACEKTVKNNHLEKRVALFLSDCLDGIPKSEKWDLVVSNPPHWPSSIGEYKKDIRKCDPGLVIHKKFYRDIHSFLKPNGSVLIQENGDATRYEDFAAMIEHSGFEIIDVFKARPLSLLECIVQGKKISKFMKPSCFYFIWSKLRQGSQ